MNNLFILMLLLLSHFISSFAKAVPPVVFKQTQVQYSLSWGNCPIKTSGDLAIILAKEYDQSKSLFELKKKIDRENWKDQYFLSSYDIKYDVFEKKLRFKFTCPKILLRVQVFKKQGAKYFSGVLVDTGEVFDPNYEVVLRREGSLNQRLPFLALSVDDLNERNHFKIISLLKKFPEKLYNQISEVVLDGNQELTLIMNSRNKVNSVYFGGDYWDVKLNNLVKINDYFFGKNNYPAQINLTSSKKIVVKFSSL